MKKFLFGLLVLLACFCMLSCSDDDDDNNDKSCNSYGKQLTLKYLGSWQTFNFYMPKKSIDKLKEESKLYPYYTTQYDEKYIDELKTKCKDYATSNGLVNEVIGLKFKDEGDGCIIDVVSCTKYEYTYSAVEEYRELPTPSGGGFGYQSDYSTLASNHTTFKLGEFIKEECKSSMSFSNYGRASAVKFNPKAEDCITTPVEGILENQHYNNEPAEIYVDNKVLKVSSLQELFNTDVNSTILIDDLFIRIKGPFLDLTGNYISQDCTKVTSGERDYYFKRRLNIVDQQLHATETGYHDSCTPGNEEYTVEDVFLYAQTAYSGVVEFRKVFSQATPLTTSTADHWNDPQIQRSNRSNWVSGETQNVTSEEDTQTIFTNTVRFLQEGNQLGVYRYDKPNGIFTGEIIYIRE